MGSASQPIVVTVNGRQFLVEVGDLNATPVIVVVEGQTYEVVVGESELELQSSDSKEEKKVRDVPSKHKEPPSKSTLVGSGFVGLESLSAPLPGDIVEVFVTPGQQVRMGDPICVLYAMKMKNVIRSPRDGRIAEVQVRLEQSVDYGTELVTYE